MAPQAVDPEQWLRDALTGYDFDVMAMFQRDGEHDWPLVARDADDLTRQLERGQHFLPLPKEPAALANVLEVDLVDYVLAQAAGVDGLDVARGTERGYPDIEFSGDAVGGFLAVDVKVARRSSSGRQTQSRVTLYTGNTYFRYPQLRWPGTFRPFNDYLKHLDIIVVYTLNEKTRRRVDDLEVVVHEPWRIASKQRSSTTREYLGAVQSLERLRKGEGDFTSREEFYRYWRRYPFNIGRAVQQQLDRLLSAQTGGSQELPDDG